MSHTPRVFYTSDTHVGHRLVARTRGFMDVTQYEEHRGEMVYKADTDAHDNYLADYWDNTVRKDDIIVVAGDISINGSEYALDWHADRPGHKILVFGNHDKPHPHNRDAHKHFERWGQVFDLGMFSFIRRKLEGKYLLVSHYPYLGTGEEGRRGLEARDPQYRLPDMERRSCMDTRTVQSATTCPTTVLPSCTSASMPGT